MLLLLGKHRSKGVWKKVRKEGKNDKEDEKKEWVTEYSISTHFIVSLLHHTEHDHDRTITIIPTSLVQINSIFNASRAARRGQ